MFINIHTHGFAQADEWSLNNLHETYHRMEPGKNYSLGVHPWHIQDADMQLNELEQYLSKNQVLAIGECGLDRLCPINFSLQENVFSRQVVMANTINKPLIIHCVKAFDQLNHILGKRNNNVPVIIHGFNRNHKLASQLIDAGFYLSLGKSVFSTSMETVIKQIPPKRIFFENDIATIAISAIYEKAAELMRMPVNALSLQVQQNAEKVLHISF